jgi:hypothetical protein
MYTCPSVVRSDRRQDRTNPPPLSGMRVRFCDLLEQVAHACEKKNTEAYRHRALLRMVYAQKHSQMVKPRLDFHF